jgi:hypothetical protein
MMPPRLLLLLLLVLPAVFIATPAIGDSGTVAKLRFRSLIALTLLLVLETASPEPGCPAGANETCSDFPCAEDTDKLLQDGADDDTQATADAVLLVVRLWLFSSLESSSLSLWCDL